MPQVAGGVADDSGEAPAVCPLVLPPKHGQLCLRKVPEVGHHILPNRIRGRPLQAATQPVRQVLLVATSGNSSLSGSGEQWHSLRGKFWLLGHSCRSFRQPHSCGVVSDATQCCCGHQWQPQPCQASQQSARQLLLPGAHEISKSVRQPHSRALSIRQQHSSQGVSVRQLLLGAQHGTPRPGRQQPSSQAMSEGNHCCWAHNCLQCPGQVAAAVAADCLWGLFTV